MTNNAPQVSAPVLVTQRWHLTALVACAVLVGAAGYCMRSSREHPHEPIASPRSDEEGGASEDGLVSKFENAHARAGAAAESRAVVRTRTLCVCFLCLQYSAYALLRRYSTGILREEWSAASVLGAGELLKACISIGVIALSGATDAPPGQLLAQLQWLMRRSLKMAVPAVLYLAMNMLGFVSLLRIDAGTFAIVQQSKMFFTALFQRIFLARTLSLPKWSALIVLVLGVLLISLESQPKTAPGPALPSAGAGHFDAKYGEYVVGVLAVTIDSALSGFATVYFEKVLKTTTLTVWDRNLQLSAYSVLIYLPLAMYDHPERPLHGWSIVTVFVSMLGALGGILVALVIKYADSLAKNIATASSIVLTTAAGHLLFSGPMNTNIVLGSLIVIVSLYNYQNVP